MKPKPNQRGQAAVNLLWAIAVVVIIAAILKLFGVDVTGAFGDAVNWSADKIGDGYTWLVKKAQGRN